MKYSGLLALFILIVVLLIFLRHEARSQDKAVEIVEPQIKQESYSLNIDDEQATVACLIAAIECRNEYKKDVRIINVREVR